MFSIKARSFLFAMFYGRSEGGLIHKGQAVTVVGISLVDVVKDDGHLHSLLRYSKIFL